MHRLVLLCGLLLAFVLTDPHSVVAETVKQGKSLNPRPVHILLDIPDRVSSRTEHAIKDFIRIAILGSEELNVRHVSRRGLRFSSLQGPSIPPRFVSKRQDVNGDGFLDLLVHFELKILPEIDGAPDRLSHGVLHGVMATPVLPGTQFEVSEFNIALPLESGSTPASNCTPMTSGGANGELLGMRCTFHNMTGTGFYPVEWASLIDGINASLVNQGSSKQVVSNSFVMIEAYGGNGHEGKKDEQSKPICIFSCTASGGKGGKRAWAYTIPTVENVTALLEKFNSTGLWIYPGESGPNFNTGGSSSIVSPQELIADKPPADDPISAGMLLIAAGGGGGSGGTVSGCDCHHGHDGGSGNTPGSETFANFYSQGGTGSGNTKGGGTFASSGNCVGGTTSNGGVGGFGGENPHFGTELAVWKTPSVGDFAGGRGAATDNSRTNGSGGGGCGGGAAGGGANSGGAGGSFSRISSVDPEDVPDEFFVGDDTSVSGEVILTFEVVEP